MSSAGDVRDRIEDVIARYRLSAATAGNPTLMGEVLLLPNGRLRASGGDDAILEVLKSRRDEVAAWLSVPCTGCSGTPADWVTVDGDRLCLGCFEARARELGAELDRREAERAVSSGAVLSEPDAPAHHQDLLGWGDTEAA